MPTLVELSQEERDVAQELFQLLEPHLRGGRELRSVAEHTHVSFRTLRRWVAGYKRDGLAGLLRKERVDRGDRRTISPQLRQAVEELALERPLLPLSSVRRHGTQFAQRIGEAAPSYWVVRDIVLSLPKDLQTLAQQRPRTIGYLLLREEGSPAQP